MADNWTPLDFGLAEDTTKNIIKVIGVGGGGCNAVKNMYAEGIINVSFAVCNTDSQSLSKSPVPVKIMLGKSGLGAGANPEVGRAEAQNTQEDIKRLLDDGTKMVFVTAGMGGGTGTGAAPVIAGIAKSISELITVEGTINLDFRDIETTIKSGGGAIMAMGRASGEGRVQNAILNALDSPLLYGSDISNAQRILFNIYTSSKHPIFVKEMREIDAFFDELNPDIKVIWGLSDDDTLDEDAKVTILATGLNNELANEIPDNAHKNKEEDDYDTIIEQLYHPIRDRINPTSQVATKNAPNAEIGNKTELESESNSMEEDDSNISISDDKPLNNSTAENPDKKNPEPGHDTVKEPVIQSPKKLTLAERIRIKLLKLAEDFDIVTMDDE
nr:cell division protein FtsZ [Prevotella sp.]